MNQYQLIYNYETVNKLPVVFIDAKKEITKALMPFIFIFSYLQTIHFLFLLYKGQKINIFTILYSMVTNIYFILVYDKIYFIVNIFILSALTVITFVHTILPIIEKLR